MASDPRILVRPTIDKSAGEAKPAEGGRTHPLEGAVEPEGAAGRTLSGSPLTQEPGWRSCPLCWGQRQIWHEGALGLFPLPCENCFGIGEVLA